MKYETPVLDSRAGAQVFAELLARRPAYVPEWLPVEGNASWALLQIFSRYMQLVIERLNQSPDKNFLAFLDTLGISLIPAGAARAPVVFQPIPNAIDGRIIAGTRLGAQVSGRPDPVMFEIENSIAMAAAHLVEVVTLWPTRDEYADHSLLFIGGRPFTLFKDLQPVPHEIYLAHHTLFAFDGEATVEIEFELATMGSSRLSIDWQYWDGQVWRSFKSFDASDATASRDGTDGLTRSGVVTLRAACGRSEKTTVNGVNTHWVRGRLDQSLPPDPAQVLPEVDRIRLRTSIERRLKHSFINGDCIGDIEPDQAFADGAALDVSKSFFPFGQAPNKNSAFYFTNDDAFSKIGANVTVCFSRKLTSEEEADRLGTQYEIDVNKARELLLDTAKTAARTLVDTAQTVLAIAVPFPFGGDRPETTALRDKVTELRNAITALTDITGIQELVNAAEIVVTAMPDVPVGVVRLGPGGGVVAVELTGTHIMAARVQALQAAQKTITILLSLTDLSAIEAAAAGGAPPITLEPAKLAWEYWNGDRWQKLFGPVDNDASNFLEFAPPASDVSFIVPKDIESIDVNGAEARWVRVRLVSGSYNRVRLVSWFDSQSNNVNFFPVIEPRPPALEAFFLGYTYRSPWEQPEHCFTYNDFRVELHSRDVRVPGRVFPPFHPVLDTTPALYLGFGRPLPNDLISLFLDIQENEAPISPLIWEAWNGASWRELSVSDETAGLRRPGVVSFIAPDVAPRPEAVVTQANGTRITVSSASEAAKFRPGDQVVIRKDKNSELRIVNQIQGDVVILETPLTHTYTGGSVSFAALPRFGTPCDWVRARLKNDGAPVESVINGIHLNAAWAVQVQTISDEVLGSGNGQPRQTFFFTRTAVLPGERIEVRELEGARAEVELPMLKEELRAQGLAEENVRTVVNPRTGTVTEVWVQWQSCPHLFFSGSDDRHYVLERARGRLIFGDGRNGRLPSVSANNIRARRYQAGGGLVGNVPAGKITQLLSTVPSVQAVNNPRAADGGAEGETLEPVRTRGANVLRHRYRSLSASDYEALSREASPGVAAVRVLPATAPNGRPVPGWVTVIIVPQSQEPRPQPSFELRRRVHKYLAARIPATVAVDRIAVIGPTYLPIGISANVAPRDIAEAGAVEERVQIALASFLHPLSGGPDGCGWPFGRDVFLSDVAAVVENVEGVDYSEELNLLLNDTPRGERIDVPSDRIVVSGPVRIEMKAAER